MKRFLCFLLLCARLARAEDCSPPATAQTILEQEAQFLRTAQEDGARTAFLAFLADDAIGFEPGPVNARKELETRPEISVSIKWQPLLVGVARSCDLAYTTGPSEWRKHREDEKPFGYGQYVTIWKKQKDGTWKVAVDLGGEGPGATKAEETPEVAIDTGPSPAPNAAGAAKKLRQAEKWYADTAATDSTGALIGSSSEDVRVYRGGVFPAIGRAPARLMLSVRRGQLQIEPLGRSISQANDLAYSYGKYTLIRPEKTERGHYLQIWRTDVEGAWRLMLDYQTPLPSKEKK
ncbi:MAG: YybH family protein [Chthoniobacterales bacterium]